MKKLISITSLALVLTPSFAFAALTGIKGLLGDVGELVRTATVVVAGIALLVFFWGLVKFILKVGGDAKAVEDGRKLMIWGVVAIFVMVSIWGLIGFIQRQLGILDTASPAASVPSIPVTPGFPGGGLPGTPVPAPTSPFGGGGTSPGDDGDDWSNR